MRRVWAAVVAILPIHACESFARSCTEVGCSDGLSVTVKPTGTAFEPGEYRFTLDEDGRSRTIACTVGPLPSHDSRCDSTDVFPVSGAEGIVAFGLRLGVVRRVIVTLTNVCATAPLVRAELTPTYTRTAPNGESCGPICDQASETITAKGSGFVICDDAGVRD